MKITVTPLGAHSEVSLWTADMDLVQAARFKTLADAMEFAEFWADWVDCPQIEVLEPPADPALSAAA